MLGGGEDGPTLIDLAYKNEILDSTFENIDISISNFFMSSGVSNKIKGCKFVNCIYKKEFIESTLYSIAKRNSYPDVQFRWEGNQGI